MGPRYKLPWAEMSPFYGWALVMGRSPWILSIDGPWAEMNLISYRNVWALGRDGPLVSGPGHGWAHMYGSSEWMGLEQGWAISMYEPWARMSPYDPSGCVGPGEGCSLAMDGPPYALETDGPRVLTGLRHGFTPLDPRD